MKRGDRHGAGEGLGLVHTLAFVIGEEEQLVLPVEHVRDHHRTADVESELVQPEGRNGIGVGVEVILGVKGRVAKEFVGRPVQSIRTGLDIHVDHARPAAIGRRGRAGLHLEFPNSVHGRKKDKHARAVDHGPICASSAGIALQNGIRRAAAIVHARGETDELGKVARVQRKVDHLPFRPYVAQLRRRRFEQRRFTLDGDFLGHAPDFESDIRGKALVDRKLKGTAGLTESLVSHRDGVLVGWKGHEIVLTGRRRGRLARDVRGLAANLHQRARNRRLRRIFDQTGNGSELKLSETDTAPDEGAEQKGNFAHLTSKD